MAPGRDPKTILDDQAAPTLFVSPQTPVIEAVKLPPAATPAKPWLDERKTVPVQTRVVPVVFEKKGEAPAPPQPKVKLWPLIVASTLAGAAATVTVLVLWRLLN